MRDDVAHASGNAAWLALAQQGLASEFRTMTAHLAEAVAALPEHARPLAAEQLAQGKHHLRSALLGGMWHALGGRDGERAGRAMAVVELVHLSTLLHDRVADHVTLDGTQTVPPNAGLVLGGDAVVVGALVAAQALGPGAVGVTLAALQRLIRAELLELGHRGEPGVPMADAVDMARLRTGALWRLCAELPAAMMDHPHGGALGDAMESLGLAWHWGEDLAELRGPGAGRRALVDLREGSCSTLVAWAVARQRWLAGALRRAGTQRLEEPRVGRVVVWGLARSGALAAVAHQQQAMEAAGVAALTRVVARGGFANVLWGVLDGVLAGDTQAAAA